VTGNTSPLTVNLKFFSKEDGGEYWDGETYHYETLEYGIGGGSEIYELGSYYSTKQLEHKTDVTLYNFTGEKTSAKVELKRIDPVNGEIKLNEKISKTVESNVEIYTFTPSVTDYYQLNLEGISSLYMKTNGYNGKTIKSGKVNKWKAGNTYTFYVYNAQGKQISMNIKKVNNVYFYDYDQCAAFVASGGSITLMNSSDVPGDLYEEADNGYGTIRDVGDNKVLVISTKNFVNMNDRWYPEQLYSKYVDVSRTTYGDMEQCVKMKYEGRVYKGLYDEKLNKVSASDPISNPYFVAVKYAPEYIAVQQIKLTGPTVMKVGDTATLQAVLDTMNEYAPTNSTVTWSSSNSNVIAVNAKGEIIAKAPGTATITVKSNDKLGKSTSIAIQAYQDVVYADAVTISGAQSVYVGDSIQLTAKVTAKNNATPTVNGVTWTTSDTTVAKVDTNGKVTGLKQGTVTITATSKDGKALGTYTISVQNVVEQKISLNESKITMKKGTKYTWLKVDFKPENTTDKSLKWESNNKKVATVNDNGVLNAKGIGKATITVTSANGKTDKVTVTVTKYAVKVKKVSITSKQTLMEGEKVTLPLEVTPVNATNQKMKWKSSNEDVATVNSKGVVTAKKAGKATITATAQDGSKKSAKCTITVKELSHVKSVKVKSAKKKTVEISWAPVKDADGYVVYMATEKNGKYQKIATTKKDATSYSKTKLKSKKTYYFKVCAIRKVGKKQYEGKMSKVAKVKVK
ncbi:MAG: Ig-like domain-containing protein, partial [Lachnospiraceae bacterium]|nr:Ig-like domain-containing protein [Lachnospiraceae bacterium]